MKLAIYITAAVVAAFLMTWLVVISMRDGSDTSEHSNMDLDGPDDDAAATVAMEREDKQP